MSNCLLELQQAIYSALTEDAMLSGMVTGVFNHVPQDTAFPYISFAVEREQSVRTRTSRASEVVVTLNMYSRYLGDTEVLEIAEEVRRILDDESLTLTDCAMWPMRFESQEVVNLDGFTWRCNMDFKTLVQESD